MSSNKESMTHLRQTQTFTLMIKPGFILCLILFKRIYLYGQNLQGLS